MLILCTFQKCKEKIQKYMAILRYNGPKTVLFFPFSQLTSSLAKKKQRRNFAVRRCLDSNPRPLAFETTFLPLDHRTRVKPADF